MTIITKTSTGKKEDAGVLPLFHQQAPQVSFNFVNVRHIPIPQYYPRVYLRLLCNACIALSLWRWWLIAYSTTLRALINSLSQSLSFRCCCPIICHHRNIKSPDGYPIIVAEQQPRRVNYPCRAVFILILVALTVLLLGILGSSILARFYGNQHTERMRFQCRLPYRSEDMNRQALLDFGSFHDGSTDSDEDSHDELRLANTVDWMRELTKNWLKDEDSSNSNDNDSDDDDDAMEMDTNAQRMLEKFFTEQVDLDMGEHADDEGVTKIDVPDFKDGRVGRFLHDFLYNQTVIVDKETSRCFLMPLDREKVLPPTSFRDMMLKMFQGKYQLDMQVVQMNMRVVVPALKEFSDVSPRIMQECGPATMRLYRLEKFVHGVVKRSVDLTEDAKFGVFAGRMVQYDLHNMEEVAVYEGEDKAAGQV